MWLALPLHIAIQASAAGQTVGRVVVSEQDEYAEEIRGGRPRFEDAIKLFGITNTELKYSSPDLFECLRSYLDLKRQQALLPFDRVNRDRVKDILKDILAENPKVVAAFVVAGRDGGFVYGRSKTGLYKQIAAAGDLVAGIVVRGSEPSVFEVSLGSDSGEQENKDYWFVWQDQNKKVRLRKSYFNDDADTQTKFSSCDDYSPRFVIGSWSDYTARRPVLLKLTADDEKKGLKSLYEMLTSKSFCERIRQAALAHLSAAKESTENTAIDEEKVKQLVSTAKVKWLDFAEPTTLPNTEIFILGDYLLSREDNPEDRVFVAEFLPAT